MCVYIQQAICVKALIDREWGKQTVNSMKLEQIVNKEY